MIADLKADSQRWELEREQTASRGQASNGISLRDSDGIVRKSNVPIVGYISSSTHETRQYYGPTDRGHASSDYPSSGSAGTPLRNTYDAPVYQQQSQYAQPASSGYAPSSGYPIQDNYYVAGANLERLEPERSARIPVSSANVPRNTYAPNPAPTYQQAPESRYYSVPTPVTQAQQVYPQDPYNYGRGAYRHQPFPPLKTELEKRSL